MNKYIYTLPLLAATLTLSSCFKEEPLNSECDITHVSLHTDNPLATFYQLSDTAKDVLSTDSLISFEVRREHEADLSLLTPTLRLSTRRTAESGTIRWSRRTGTGTATTRWR